MNLLSLLTLFGGSAPYIDITPDPDTMAMIEEDAACDKHRILLNKAQIEALQQRIIERGGIVAKDDGQ